MSEPSAPKKHGPSPCCGDMGKLVGNCGCECHEIARLETLESDNAALKEKIQDLESLDWVEIGHERIPLLEASLKRVEAENADLRERLERAEAALQEYANLDNWANRIYVTETEPVPLLWVGSHKGPDFALKALAQN